MQPVEAGVRRAGYWPFAAAWLFACGVLVVLSAPHLQSFIFPDPDDLLRLQQVRDWLGGQSWFDVTQYRMNPPLGGPMHWSRLVDVPIAAVILAARPLLGTSGAEYAALILVPLLTLGLVMALVAKLTRRLLDREHAILACLLTPLSINAIQQLRPLRIDHHGWQIVLALVATLAALDGNRRRSGLIAGVATALWLQISLEGLPLAAAVVALFGLRWVIDPREGERLGAMIVTLAAASLVLLGLTKAADAWGAAYCDSISFPYLALLAVGAAGCVALIACNPRTPVLRLIGLGAVCAAGLATVALIAPPCLKGPFQALDPVVEAVWYRNIAEGLPIWEQSAAVVCLILAFPIVGLFGTWQAAQAHGADRLAWWSLLFLLGAATMLMLLVQRGAAVANLLALPGGTFLFESALSRGRTQRNPALRLFSIAGAMALVVPGYLLGAAAVALAGDSGKTAALTAIRQCVDAKELGRLDALPPSLIAAPLDIGPAILVNTHHRIVASGHHRNGAAMRDVIDIFTLPPSQARQRLARRRVDLVVVCPNLIEPAVYKDYAPRGLWAQIDAGRTPDWLQPVPLAGDSALRVWRVTPLR